MSKGYSGRPRSFSNGGHSTGSDNQSLAAHGEESSNNGCVQNSKNAQDSSKTNQMRGCDVKGTSACQAANSMVGLDNLDASLRVVR